MTLLLSVVKKIVKQLFTAFSSSFHHKMAAKLHVCFGKSPIIFLTGHAYSLTQNIVAIFSLELFLFVVATAVLKNKKIK